MTLNKLLLLLTIVLNNSLYGQNWKLINTTDKYNYSIGSEVFNSTIWIDSLNVLNGDTTFFLNHKMDQIEITNFFENNFLDNQPTFLYKKHIYSNSGSVILNSDNDSIMLQLNAPINTKWLSQPLTNDSAQIIYSGIQSIFGIQDSIKTILTTRNDSIIISKNHGIIKFPSYDSTSRHYSLSGIEGRNLGKIVPNFSRIFDFSIGDEFHYTKIVGVSPATYYFYKYRILSKSSTPNQITYVVDLFEKISTEYFGGQPNVSYRRDTAHALTFTEEDIHSKFNMEILVKDFKSNNGNDYKPVRIRTDTTFQCIEKYIPKNQHCLQNDTIREGLGPYCSDYIIQERFGEGFGLLEKSYTEYGGSRYPNIEKERLVGCIKNGIVYGTLLDSSVFGPLNHVSLSEFKFKNNLISLHPNPASSVVSIHTELEIKFETIEIINSSGQIVMQSLNIDVPYFIEVESLPSGIYYLKALDIDNNSYVKKFIKK